MTGVNPWGGELADDRGQVVGCQLMGASGGLGLEYDCLKLLLILSTGN